MLARPCCAASKPEPLLGEGGGGGTEYMCVLTVPSCGVFGTDAPAAGILLGGGGGGIWCRPMVVPCGCGSRVPLFCEGFGGGGGGGCGHVEYNVI